MKIITAVLLVLLSSQIAIAGEKAYGNIPNVEYVHNYDGDTVTFNISNYPAIVGDRIDIRIFGIDTPEMHGKCLQEKAMAIAARDFVGEKLRNAKSITLVNIKRDKYFRILAEIWIDNQSLARMIINNGFAVEYYGEIKSKDWCK